jgi:hypothetical protein
VLLLFCLVLSCFILFVFACSSSYLYSASDAVSLDFCRVARLLPCRSTSTLVLNHSYDMFYLSGFYICT